MNTTKRLRYKSVPSGVYYVKLVRWDFLENADATFKMVLEIVRGEHTGTHLNGSFHINKPKSKKAYKKMMTGNKAGYPDDLFNITMKVKITQKYNIHQQAPYSYITTWYVYKKEPKDDQYSSKVIAEQLREDNANRARNLIESYIVDDPSYNGVSTC